MQERARRMQLPFEETDTLIFGPIIPRIAGDARGAEKLRKRLCVKNGVLADIELGEMKAKDLDATAHGGDIGLHEPPRADLVQCLREQIEIAQQLDGDMIVRVVLQQLGIGPERETRMAEFVKDTPLRRFGTPDEVAAVALLLASDEASYMTGAELNIDGGILAGSAASPGRK